MPVATEITIAKVVGKNDDDIRFFGGKAANRQQ
jgi:hypothetical protein